MGQGREEEGMVGVKGSVRSKKMEKGVEMSQGTGVEEVEGVKRSVRYRKEAPKAYSPEQIIGIDLMEEFGCKENISTGLPRYVSVLPLYGNEVPGGETWQRLLLLHCWFLIRVSVKTEETER